MLAVLRELRLLHPPDRAPPTSANGRPASTSAGGRRPSAGGGGGGRPAPASAASFAVPPSGELC
eukprot:1610806-Prymnesium_polylepis.1